MAGPVAPTGDYGRAHLAGETVLAEEAARAIHSEFRAWRGDKPLKVVFMAKDADEVEVFEMAIEGTG